MNRKSILGEPNDKKKHISDTIFDVFTFVNYHRNIYYSSS